MNSFILVYCKQGFSVLTKTRILIGKK